MSPLLVKARWAGACVALLAGAVALPQSARADDSREERLKSRLDSVDQALEAWDVDGAQAALAEVEGKGGGDDEAALYFRGRIAFERGEYPRAIELLEKAGVQDRPGSYLRLAKDTQSVVEHYQRQESAHFIFEYPPGKDEILAPYALETLESQRQALLQDLGHAPAGGKVRVEVVGNAKELARVSTLTLSQIRTTGTIAICKFNKLMVTSPKAVLKGYDWQDTLAHEYTHLVISQKSKNTVPIWLHEGMAKYLESRWRGAAGLAMSPSTLALLGSRVKKDRLIPFEKMHPSIALLPTAEDAATAFAEVFYAVDLIFKEQGTRGLQTIIDELARGKTDRRAVEVATSRSFDAFERAWLQHVKKQQFPRELIPLSDVKVVLREDAPGKKKEDKKREIGFGDFREVEEEEGRKFAHLGELLREKGRHTAAAEEYGRAYRVVGDKYESVSNKYALALLEVRRTEEAERVLEGSLRVHPGSPYTNVHLGRIHLWRQEWSKARAAYLDALSADPFDEEIHFALLRANSQMGNKALAERARQAAMKLTGLPAESVDKVAQQLARGPGAPGGEGGPGGPGAPGAATGQPPGGAAADAGSQERN